MDVSDLVRRRVLRLRARVPDTGGDRIDASGLRVLVVADVVFRVVEASGGQVLPTLVAPGADGRGAAALKEWIALLGIHPPVLCADESEAHAALGGPPDLRVSTTKTEPDNGSPHITVGPVQDDRAGPGLYASCDSGASLSSDAAQGSDAGQSGDPVHGGDAGQSGDPAHDDSATFDGGTGRLDGSADQAGDAAHGGGPAHDDGAGLGGGPGSDGGAGLGIAGLGGDPLALRLALLSRPHEEAVWLGADVLDDAARTLERWRAAVARWAEYPSHAIPARTAEAMRGTLAELDTSALLGLLRDVADDDAIAPGAKFETFAWADRVLALDLPRQIGRT